jgi:hypothetical protein
MPATEGEIKLVARITALEILVQHLICLACNRDLDEVEDYRERVMEDASVTSVKGFDPAASDLLAAELQARWVKKLKHPSGVASSGGVPRSEHRGSPHFCSWLLRITLAKTGAALLFRGPRNSSSTCFVGSNKFDETGIRRPVACTK